MDDGGGARGGAGPLAPVSAVLEACVVQPVVRQYHTITHACWRVFTQELRLLDLCAALRWEAEEKGNE